MPVIRQAGDEAFSPVSMRYYGPSSSQLLVTYTLTLYPLRTVLCSNTVRVAAAKSWELGLLDAYVCDQFLLKPGDRLPLSHSELTIPTDANPPESLEMRPSVM